MPLNSKKAFWTAGISVAVNVLLIAFLIFFRSQAQHKLERIADLLDELGESRINYTVKVTDTLPISTDFNVTQKVRVFVQMQVKNSLELKQQIPIDQKLIVPIKIEVKQMIHVDTAVMINGELIVPVNDTIPVRQRVMIPTKGQKGKGIKVPIIVDIPIHQDLRLKFRDPLPFKTSIPIDIPVNQDVPISLKMDLPVDMNIPLDIPVASDALITFPYKLPVSGKIPLKMDVPVNIPLSETPIKEKANKIGEVMRKLLDLW